MSSALATTQEAIIEKVLIGGDLASLTTEQRLNYYQTICKSLGLNPVTRPFEYITLNNKLTLYAKKDCTDQLRKLHAVSVTELDAKAIDDIYVVTVTGKDNHGRSDSATGAVTIAGLKGDAKANAMMKAETKAKRRLTLSICGLGMLDETEVESIPGARPMPQAQMMPAPQLPLTSNEPDTAIDADMSIPLEPLPANVFEFQPEIVSSKKTSRGTNNYGVKCPDGQFANSFSDTDGALLIEARDEKRMVRLTWEMSENGKFRNIKSIQMLQDC